MCFEVRSEDQQNASVGSRGSAQSEITIPRGLEGRVNFWLLIFTKYNKDQRVFHNRNHPEIIYSVLDFSEFEQKLSGKTLMNSKLSEINTETKKIENSLLYLASGKKPRDDFEQRIERSYKAVSGHRLSRYKEGTEADVIRYQTGIKEKFRDSIIRSGRYLSAIEHIFEEEGLPTELGRMPFIESSFDYTAYSSVGAAGIWQFMPATAKKYMTVNNTLDERRDPIISTRAAALYLKNAYKNTESWPLAVTSYNHGLTGILRGAKAVGSNDIVKIIDKYEAKSFGFASSNFYAELLAALIVDRNVQKYFPGIKREDSIEFDEVKLSKRLQFKSLVSYSGATSTEIRELNLSLKDRVLNGRVDIPAGTLVKVPYGAGKKVIAKLSGSRIITSSHVFKNKKIANSGHLIDENQLQKQDLLESAEIIKGKSRGEIPHIELGEEIAKKANIHKDTPIKSKLDLSHNKPSARSKRSINAKVVKKSKSYVVKKGDTVYDLARQFNISEAELLKKLKIKKGRQLRPGMKFTF